MAHRRGSIVVVTDDRLDEIAQMIGGQDFNQLHPEHKVKIYDLALKEHMAMDLHEIRRWFEESRTFDGFPS